MIADDAGEECRTYWGSHGCRLPRGHGGPCVCRCADDPPEPGVLNVGAPPYYGPETRFYGEDSAGLPQVEIEEFEE